VSAIKAAVPSARLLVPPAKLDLGSLESVRAFGLGLRQSVDRIDLLCLNAGRGGSKGDPRQLTVDGHESIMQVNALAHVLLTAELMPLLRRSPAARVVSQTSGARLLCARCRLPEDLNHAAAAEPYNAFDQYCLSKAANCIFTQALNDTLAAVGIGNIVALVAEPGFACTGINVQHNLGHSMVGLPDGLLSTETMHMFGHHAADGALPMVLGCIDPAAAPNSWYGPPGVTGLPVLRDPAGHSDAKHDPLNEASEWPVPGTRREFWRQAVAYTRADFRLGAKGPYP